MVQALPHSQPKAITFPSLLFFRFHKTSIPFLHGLPSPPLPGADKASRLELGLGGNGGGRLLAAATAEERSGEVLKLRRHGVGQLRNFGRRMLSSSSFFFLSRWVSQMKRTSCLYGIHVELFLSDFLSSFGNKIDLFIVSLQSHDMLIYFILKSYYVRSLNDLNYYILIMYYVHISCVVLCFTLYLLWERYFDVWMILMS